jgi:hypothetical protein
LNNLGTQLVKIVVLAGGAVIGALVARWCDNLLATKAEQRSEYDRTRYAQGLAPRAPQSPMQTHQG